MINVMLQSRDCAPRVLYRTAKRGRRRCAGASALHRDLALASGTPRRVLHSFARPKSGFHIAYRPPRRPKWPTEVEHSAVPCRHNPGTIWSRTESEQRILPASFGTGCRFAAAARLGGRRTSRRLCRIVLCLLTSRPRFAHYFGPTIWADESKSYMATYVQVDRTTSRVFIAYRTLADPILANRSKHGVQYGLHKITVLVSIVVPTSPGLFARVLMTHNPAHAANGEHHHLSSA